MQNADLLNKQRLASKQLEDQQGRLNKAKDLLLSGDLEAAYCRSIKKEVGNRIATLQHTPYAIADPQEAVNKMLKRYDTVLRLLLSEGRCDKQA